MNDLDPQSFVAYVQSKLDEIGDDTIIYFETYSQRPDGYTDVEITVSTPQMDVHLEQRLPNEEVEQLISEMSIDE